MTSTEPCHVGTFVPTPSWLIKSDFVTFAFAAFVSFVLSSYAISGLIKSDSWSSFLVLFKSYAIYPKRNLTHSTNSLSLYPQTSTNMQAHSKNLGALDQRLESNRRIFKQPRSRDQVRTTRIGPIDIKIYLWPMCLDNDESNKSGLPF